MPGWPPRCELVVFGAASLPRSIGDPHPAVVRALDLYWSTFVDDMRDGAFASEVLTAE